MLGGAAGRALLAALVVSLLFGSTAGSSTVVVDVETPWLETPALMEASEHIGRESADGFWAFVEAVAAGAGDGCLHKWPDRRSSRPWTNATVSHVNQCCWFSCDL